MIEEFRKRIIEIREKIKAKRLLGEERGVLRGSETRGQVIGGVIGGGKIIESISKTIDQVLTIAKERRPNIIPTVLERIKTYEPGKRIKELLPPATTGAPTTPETTTTPQRKILRE